MTVPNNPGQGGYQRQPGQGGYQQPSQQGWASPAFSAVPAPEQDAYGQQSGQDVHGQNPQGYVQSGADAYGYSQQIFPQPKQDGGFTAAFSMNLQNESGVTFVKVVRLISLIAGVGFTLYGLFEFLIVAMSRGGALQIFTYLAKAVAYTVFELLLPTFSRTVFEHAVDDKEQRVLQMDSTLRRDYRFMAFDLDDTFAPSKSPPPDQMAVALRRLLDLVDVCMISGGQLGQFSSQLLSNLGASAEQLGRPYLTSTCGTRYIRCTNGQWTEIYARDPTVDGRCRVMEVLESQACKLGLWYGDTWGPVLEDHGPQITFSALGQETPLEEKGVWDPDGRKKEALRAVGAALLPGFEVRSGGSTSVGATRKGIDKVYGTSELSPQMGIAVSDMLFVSDCLDEGGNDYPVLCLGIDAHPADDWQDTARFVEGYTAVHTPGRADMPGEAGPQSSQDLSRCAKP